MTLKRTMPLAAYMVFGAFFSLETVSRAPLWRVDRLTGHLAGISYGSFWEFLDELPSALKNLSVTPGPNTVFFMLPTVYLWENVRTTLVIMATGAAAGAAFESLVRRVQSSGLTEERKADVGN